MEEELKRPISDLFKKIEVNGSEFIPIQQLLIIAYPNHVVIMGSISPTDYKAFATLHNQGGHTYTDICFYRNGFHRLDNKGSFSNQIQMIRKIAEWGFIDMLECSEPKKSEVITDKEIDDMYPIIEGKDRFHLSNVNNGGARRGAKEMRDKLTE